MPSRVDENKCSIDTEIRENDEKAKKKMKENADKKSGAKERDIQIGDFVLIRQKRRNKFSSNFDPKPYRVVKVKGTAITAMRNGHYVTRNISFYKRILKKGNMVDFGEGIENDLNENTIVDPMQNMQENQLPARYPQRNRQRTQRFGQTFMIRNDIRVIYSNSFIRIFVSVSFCYIDLSYSIWTFQNKLLWTSKYLFEKGGDIMF